MAGILDLFQTTDPAQQQGLLAAAAQMLQASGPSLMPHSLGQIVGGGIGAYQQGMSAAQEAAQKKALAEQAQALNGFKIKDAESDLKNQEAARKRALELASVSSDYFGGGNPASMLPGAQSVAAPQGAANVDPSTAAQPQGAGSNKTLYQQHLDYAAFLRQKGYGPEADAQEEKALKFQPKVKELKPMTVGGKTLYVPVFEDGTPGQPVPYEVAEKLNFQNLGGKTVGLNPFTGAQAASFNNTASPEAQLAAQTAGARLAFDKSQTGKPTFNADAGGFVYAPNANNPNGAFQPLQGFDKGKAPTEFQGKSASFALRAGEANKTIGELTGKYSPAAINSKQTVENTWLVGGALGAATNKFAMSEKDQKAEQAQRDFINAVLRQESGASIGASEFDNARKQYFPQPGDTPGVIEQKARNRDLAVQALTANAGRAALTAPPRATATNGWSIKKVGD